MRCHRCGCAIPKGQGIRTTRDERVGPAGRKGESTRTTVIVLCVRCARAQDVALWFACGMLMLLIVLVLVDWFFRG